jgi:guanylate kinase
VSVFIIPPSAQALTDRLGGRNTERPNDLVARLRRAVEELDDAGQYDYVVVNTDRTQAVAEVAAIIDAESRRPGRLPELAEALRDLARQIAAQADLLERT